MISVVEAACPPVFEPHSQVLTKSKFAPTNTGACSPIKSHLSTVVRNTADLHNGDEPKGLLHKRTLTLYYFSRNTIRDNNEKRSRIVTHQRIISDHPLIVQQIYPQDKYPRFFLRNYKCSYRNHSSSGIFPFELPPSLRISTAHSLLLYKGSISQKFEHTI